MTGSAISKTIFHEPWWMEAASGGRWAEALVKANGSILARLPYVTTRHLGIVGIGMPSLTSVLGPQLPLQLGEPEWTGPSRRELLAELFSRLPPHRYFNQLCEPGFTNALPLYALGYDSRLKYTLQIPLAPAHQMKQGIRRRIRDDIRKAERVLNVDTSLEIDEFCRFYNICTQANNRLWWSSRYTRRADAVKTRIYEACRTASSGCLLAARDSTGVLRAAIMLVWDENVMYYLLTAHDAEREGAGSIKLLIWEAMKLASVRGLTFDFDGFPRPNAVNILSGFGGVVRSRINILEIPPILKIARYVASHSRFGL